MLDFRQSLMNSTLNKVLQRLHYPLQVMLTCVRWYVAYPLSLRHVEEMMQERGVFVDHVTVHRWAIKVLPVLAAVFRRRKHPVDRSWRMDETYIKVSGQWKYLYRAVDRAGDAVDFLLTAKRDLAAARRFLARAINLHDVPDAHFSDRGHLFQADRVRRFSAIVDAQGMRASEGLMYLKLIPGVQTYPRRRTALATYRPTRWVSRVVGCDGGIHWSFFLSRSVAPLRSMR